ncbi:MAG TPA: hypothetical protein VI455_08645 [Terriglobia bacterium]
MKPTSRFSGSSPAARWAGVWAWVCLAALGSWARLDYATTAVALYTKDFAVVASDGRGNKVGPVISGHQSECKLYLADEKVAVVAGLAEEPDSGFDVRRILHAVMKQATPAPRAADLVEQQIQQALPAALREFEKQNPGAFQERAAGSSQLLMVGVGSDGEIQIARRSTPYNQARRAQREDATGAADRVGVALIGDTAAIDRDLERLHNSNGWEGMANPTDLEKLARRFIALEVVDKPMQVGPPISMVLVDGNGVHWVEPGACKE